MTSSVLLLLQFGCIEPSVLLLDPIINEQDQQTLMYIPKGTYLVGSNIHAHDESPRHNIEIEDFYMGKTEVTNEAFAIFLNTKKTSPLIIRKWIGLHGVLPRGALISYTGSRFRSQYGYEDHPVIGVSYYGAKAYCTWADLRLPTEEEWEVAALGGQKEALYPWGDTPPTGKANYNKRWRDSDHNPPTSPVGSFMKNGYGLLDVAGNALEWTSSEYLPYETEVVKEEIRASLDGKRVLRGGGFDSTPYELRISFRRSYIERVRSYFTGGLGFRCARDREPS